MVVAELLAIGSAAASFISATASAALDIAQTIFALLAKMVDWTLQATQQLFTFESQQPLAFLLIFGTAIILFVSVPFVTGTDYNTLLFGSSTTIYDERPALPATFANYSDAEIASMINNIRLAQLEDVPRVQTMMQKTQRDAFLGTKSFAMKIFPQVTTFSSQEAQYLVTGATLPEIQKSWKQNRYDTCGKLVNNCSEGQIQGPGSGPCTDTVWELEIKPISPDLTNQFKAAAANANLRFYNVTLSCYRAFVNDSSIQQIGGSSKEAQVYNLRQMITNGSICQDESLGALSNTQPSTLANSPIPLISILGFYIDAITSLWRPVTTTDVTNATNCFIVYNYTTAERMYTGTPFWLANAPDANMTTKIFYQDIVLKDTRLTSEQAAALGVIGFPVTTNVSTGLLDLPTGAYRALKTTTVAATGGATTSMFDWFEAGMVILALLILGTAGTILVLNTAKIKHW